MDLLNYVETKQLKHQLPQIGPGHIVAIHQKIKEGNKERIQIFKGIVIRVKNGYGLNGSFTVRRVASGVGVEKTFLFNSPLVEKIEVVKKAKTRRAKLYYLRGLFGKSAKLNIKGEKDGAADLIRDIVGDETVKDEVKNVDSESVEVSSSPAEEVKKDKADKKDKSTGKKPEAKIVQDTKEKKKKADKPKTDKSE